MITNLFFMLTGLAIVFILAYSVSYDRKHIRYKNICILFALQIVISFLCLNTTGGVYILSQISGFFSWLLNQSFGGTEFVFGSLVPREGTGFVFFFGVLMPIVFISALVGILNFLRILPFIIKWTGWLLNKIAHMGNLESYFAISTAILGQPEVFLTIRDQIPKLSERQLYTICTSAMSAVSAAMLASYMNMLEGRFVVVAVFLNILSALIIACIVNPYNPVNDEGLIKVKKVEEPFFQVLSTYIIDGFKLAITVGAVLIGFVALITFLNNGFDALFGVTFIHLIGYIFSPIALFMGVPFNEIVNVGGIMATKLISNEFVAMGLLHDISNTLSPKSQAILSVYLVSFANFGTLGIVSGSIKSISEKSGYCVAKFSLRLLLGATLASVISGTIVGVYY